MLRKINGVVNFDRPTAHGITTVLVGENQYDILNSAIF